MSRKLLPAVTHILLLLKFQRPLYQLLQIQVLMERGEWGSKCSEKLGLNSAQFGQFLGQLEAGGEQDPLYPLGFLPE